MTLFLGLRINIYSISHLWFVEFLDSGEFKKHSQPGHDEGCDGTITSLGILLIKL